MLGLIIVRRQISSSINGPIVIWRSSYRLLQLYFNGASIGGGRCSFNIFMWVLHGTKQVARKNLIYGARTLHAFDEVFWGSEGSAVWRLKLLLICEGHACGLSPYFKRRERESIGENKYSMVKLEDFCIRVMIRFSHEVFGLTMFFFFCFFISFLEYLCCVIFLILAFFFLISVMWFMECLLCSRPKLDPFPLWLRVSFLDHWCCVLNYF